MEEQKTNQKASSSAPIKNSDDGHDPPLPAAAHGGDTPEEEDPCEMKKRKGCPCVVDKCEKKKKSALNSNYSFTFDTKICGGSQVAITPESTPKFGSFNLVATAVVQSKEKADEEAKED